MGCTILVSFVYYSKWYSRVIRIFLPKDFNCKKKILNAFKMLKKFKKNNKYIVYK